MEGTAWLTDWASGEVAALWAEEEGNPVYGLDGRLLYRCGSAMPQALIGNWLLLFTTDGYALDETWLVNMTTGEERYHSSSAALWYESDAFLLYDRVEDGTRQMELDGTIYTFPSIKEVPVLLNGKLEELHRFEADAQVRQPQTTDYALVPGFLQVGQPGGSVMLYDIARDEFWPGCFRHMVWMQGESEPLAEMSGPEGIALCRLDTREQVTAFEEEPGPYHREYLCYSPQFRIYDITDGGRCMGHIAERGGHVFTCWGAGRTPCGFYMLQKDGGLLLLDGQGEALAQYDARQESSVCSVGAPDPLLTLYSWAGGYKLISREGVCREEISPRLARLETVGEGRFLLSCYDYTEGVAARQCTLLDGSGGILLEGLNELRATALPGVWAVQQGFTVGLMDETGCWLWNTHIAPTAAEEDAK